VIVRISGERQFTLPDDRVRQLNDLDNEAVRAVEAGDEDRFKELWQQMVALVEDNGEPLPIDELVESDVIMPPRDVTFAEAKGEFTGDGLIPD
jgi:PspA-Associated protein